MEAYGWTNYVILYEDDNSLVRLQDLIKATQPPKRGASMRQLPTDGDYK